VLTHLQRPLTGRYRAEFGGGPVPAGIGGDEVGRPHRLIRVLVPHAIVAVALLLSAVLAGLATVALH
jgi:hypothetical protein